MTRQSVPVIYTWTGEVMTPMPRFARVCDGQFVVGETYRLETTEQRSQASHNHYFAAIHEGWMNLPEDQAERFATSEHLRKWCLVKAGYHDQRSIVASSKAEALRLASFVKPMDEFAVVTVSEAVVTVYTARSQSMKAMGKRDFGASKQAVLDVIAGMIGTTSEALDQARAA